MTHNKNDVISGNNDICRLLTLFTYECENNRYIIVNNVNNGMKREIM